MKIGFYDSGLGGLTILRATREMLPYYDYVYFGDTANLPYGDKSEEEIYTLAHDAIDKLFQDGASLIIVACNTISAEVLRKLQDTVFNNLYPDRRVLGVIIPTIEKLVESDIHNALLIGTRRTVASKKYERELEKKNSTIQLSALATPRLVPLIEAHEFQAAFSALQEIAHGNISNAEAVILGCTHYTVLKDMIREVYPHVTVLSQDEIIPEKIMSYLQRHNEIEAKLTRNATIEIILSEGSERYERIKKLFFNV